MRSVMIETKEHFEIAAV